MRSEITMGGMLGLVLGGLVVFGLARTPSNPSSEPCPEDLAPIELTDFVGLDQATTASPEPAYRPVRPGSRRLEDTRAARS